MMLVGERLGRKKTLAIGAVFMAIGGALQASTHGRAQMIVARIISGIGMGAINSTAPVLQAEVSPKASRGRYVCAQLSTLNFGIFLSYWIDYGAHFLPSYRSSLGEIRLHKQLRWRRCIPCSYRAAARLCGGYLHPVCILDNLFWQADKRLADAFWYQNRQDGSPTVAEMTKHSMSLLASWDSPQRRRLPMRNTARLLMLSHTKRRSLALLDGKNFSPTTSCRAADAW